MNTDRLHSLDAVRAIALLLGVVLHSTMAYLPEMPAYVLQDSSSDFLAGMFYVIHIFRMAAFFVIAGFFGRMVLERKGMKVFFKDRCKRILIPLFGGLPVVLIVTGIAFVLGLLTHGTDSFLAFIQESQATAETEAGGGGTGISLIHLWFLYYLFIFYCLMLAGRWFINLIDKQETIAKGFDRLLQWLMNNYFGSVFFAIPVAIIFFLDNEWATWVGLPAPFSLTPEPNALIGYGIPFLAGWMFHRQIPLLLNLQTSWKIYFAAACLLTVACFILIGTDSNWIEPLLFGNEKMLYVACYFVGQWCWIFAFIGAAEQFLSNPNTKIRYIADASYWIYLMHIAPIIFFHLFLAPYDLHWSIKYLITLTGSLVLLIPSYHYLVRYTWIGAILNGKRHPQPEKQTTPSHQE